MQRHALAHPGQPVTLPVAGGDPEPVVADADLDLRVEVAQHDLHPPRRDGVLEDVRQRLLGDPMDAHPHLVGQVACRALDLEPDRQAGAGEPAHQAGQVGVPLARPQHAEQPAHLGQRVPAGLGDLRQRPARRCGVARRGVAAAVGLRDHHRQRVGDHVVQVAGDPRALARRADLRLLVALDLQRRQPGAAGDPPVGQERDEQHVPGHDGGAEDEAVEHAGKRRERRHHDAPYQGGGEPDRPEPGRPVHQEGVEGDERRQVGHQHVLGDRELHEAGGHHGREHDHRCARRERQRRDQRQRHQHLLGARRHRGVVGDQAARDQLGGDEQRRDRGDGVIACMRVTIEPAVEATEQEPIIRRTWRVGGRRGRRLRPATPGWPYPRVPADPYARRGPAMATRARRRRRLCAQSTSTGPQGAAWRERSSTSRSSTRAPGRLTPSNHPTQGVPHAAARFRRVRRQAHRRPRPRRVRRVLELERRHRPPRR
ncbi:MAG: hypothetical protein AVDCRST_MAG13-1682 [uncultured Solirubrobacteraceae bacterium]|uniref:Uncharacterized protein n=1 Tax=uncultured Solirubrobacteraceae bacterium TaxID=1162706 RepID=A0A6J4SDG5_9ACTN|nr:MAG: hypothetical protein AVDCRST_MAG13-1682 [uncultured Solirubrobacteraceae bacterium]